jgi:hypothetical protein
MKVLEVPDIKYQPSSIEEKNPIPETRLVCSKLNTNLNNQHSFRLRLPVLAWCKVYIYYILHHHSGSDFRTGRHSLKLVFTVLMTCVVESGTLPPSSCNHVS